MSKEYKKLTEDEISSIMACIRPKIYIEEYTHHEEFKQVVYNNIYLPYIISSFGRLFSIHYGYTKCDKINLKEMKPTKNKVGGYYQSLLTYYDTKIICKIHRLVAYMFIPNLNKDLTIVNHKDGNKENNYSWNLEWCNHSYNTLHAYKNNLCKQNKGESSKKNKYSEYNIRIACKMLEDNTPIQKICKTTKISKRMIRHLLNYESWTHITCEYDFSNYRNGKPVDYKERIEKVCMLLESNSKTLKEISNETGISYSMVKNILNKKAHKSISKKYKISNFSNYEIKRKI